MLEHVEDDERALSVLTEATRPRGGLLVTVPQYRWLWSSGGSYGRQQRRYSKRYLEHKVQKAAFTLVRSTAWMFFLLPVLAASRMWEKRRKGRYDPRRELDMPGSINRILEAVFDGERVAIEHGLTLRTALHVLSLPRSDDN
jgi:hypothetical protein